MPVEKIFMLMAEHCVTAKEVSTATGIAASSFTEWKKGRSKPKTEALVSIADYFGVSLDYLTGRSVVAAHKESGFDDLTDAERVELTKYLRYLRSEE